jgi:hypothetical protein
MRRILLIVCSLSAVLAMISSVGCTTSSLTPQQEVAQLLADASGGFQEVKENADALGLTTDVIGQLISYLDEAADAAEVGDVAEFETTMDAMYDLIASNATEQEAQAWVPPEGVSPEVVTQLAEQAGDWASYLDCLHECASNCHSAPDFYQCFNECTRGCAMPTDY